MGCGSSRDDNQDTTFERAEPLLDFDCKVQHCIRHYIDETGVAAARAGRASGVPKSKSKTIRNHHEYPSVAPIVLEVLP